MSVVNGKKYPDVRGIGGLQLQAKRGKPTVRITAGENVCEADITNPELAAAFIDALSLAVKKSWPRGRDA